MTGSPIDLHVGELRANEISPEPDDVAPVMEEATSDQAPGGEKRERSGRLAGVRRRYVRARATGCAAGAQAGEGTGERRTHGGSRQREKNSGKSNGIRAGKKI